MDSCLLRKFREYRQDESSVVAFARLRKLLWDVKEALKDYSTIKTYLDSDYDIRCDASFFIENNFFVKNSNCTFILPNIFIQEREFKDFLLKDVVENAIKTSLEDNLRLNWWTEDLGNEHSLWPISTVGDGNCLLHAASISMWGHHDRMVEMRLLMHHFVQHSPFIEGIKRRWRWTHSVDNSMTGLMMSEKEWQEEWQLVENVSSIEKRCLSDFNIFPGLEEVHVLALAHMLRRVIVIISDTKLKNPHNEILAPNPIGGIYIPFECDIRMIHRVPLFISFDSAHFSALLCVEKEPNCDIPNQFLIPVVDVKGDLLPIKFHYDPSENYNWSDFSVEEAKSKIFTEREHLQCLKTYMNVLDVYNNNSDVDSEEEIEKRFSEELDNTTDVSLFTNKNKASKQIQDFGKQFGSLGRAFSKKIWKNFLITKNTKKNLENGRTKLYCVEVTKNMNISSQRLLSKAKENAFEEYFQKLITQYVPLTGDEIALKDEALKEGPKMCINSSCSNYSCALTHYLCESCFKRQRNHEEHYGIGNSKFYKKTDEVHYKAVENLPLKRAYYNNNTLYLSKSTFYNDTLVPSTSQSCLYSPIKMCGNQSDNVHVWDTAANVQEECSAQQILDKDQNMNSSSSNNKNNNADTTKPDDSDNNNYLYSNRTDD